MQSARKQHGFTMVGVVVGLFTLTLGLSYYGTSIVSNRKAVKKIEEENVAENYAAELLETFLSISSSQLSTYLARIPAVPGSPAYPLCAHVNLLDRAASVPGAGVVYLNRDPLADLPPGSYIDNVSAHNLRANRFYMVQVVDGGSLQVQPTACGRRTTTSGTVCGALSGNRYKLCNPYRFMVTVGVSFVPSGKDVANVQRLVVSTVLPEI